MTKVKFQTRKVIHVDEWDRIVKETYGKPYSFQQQDECRDRGTFDFEVPYSADDYENDTVPEKINHEEMGVSFKAWLERDPKQPLSGEKDGDREWGIRMWWDRDFYPNVQMIANDLLEKGILEEGEYSIDIDW